MVKSKPEVDKYVASILCPLRDEREVCVFSYLSLRSVSRTRSRPPSLPPHPPPLRKQRAVRRSVADMASLSGQEFPKISIKIGKKRTFATKFTKNSHPKRLNELSILLWGGLYGRIACLTSNVPKKIQSPFSLFGWA